MNNESYLISITSNEQQRHLEKRPRKEKRGLEKRPRKESYLISITSDVASNPGAQKEKNEKKRA